MEAEERRGNTPSGGKSRVRVAIRVRPMIERERGDRSCVECRGEGELVIGGERSYRFDHVFGGQTPQQTVYLGCIRELVVSCFEGYNAAVLAYGQTGSGKTFTMGTAGTEIIQPHLVGIIPRVAYQIFNTAKQKECVEVRCSFIEIYNEQIIDLLADPQLRELKGKDGGVAIREERDGSVTLAGVKEEQVVEEEGMLRLLERGGRNRTTATTLMNSASSRSHAIFTVSIRQSTSDDGSITAKFYFVDLAGSQRIKKTGATGDVLKQGISINMGLLQLGNVISALSTIDKNRQQFITFRNSKLTRILQDCLGGNSNTYMIACVSPAQSNYEESLNTLKYASKAMNIKNTPIVNRDEKTMLKETICSLQGENRKLKRMLAEQGLGMPEEKGPSEEERRLRDENRQLLRRCAESGEAAAGMKGRVGELERRVLELRKEKDLFRLSWQAAAAEHPQLLQAKQQAVLQWQHKGKQGQSLIDEYRQQVAELEEQLAHKRNMCRHLQAEYNALLADSARDEKILIQKNVLLHKVTRENARLRKIVQGDGKSEVVPVPVPASSQEMIELEEEVEEGEGQEGEELDRKQEQARMEMQAMEKQILQREKFLEEATIKQIGLQSQLIGEMKMQYHNKIAQLERQRTQLLKQKDQGGSGHPQRSKFVSKIQQLQTQLKTFRKKAKQQRNMQRLVDSQTNKIKDLAQQIKRFKTQKGELNKRMKMERQNYQQLRSKRTKEAMAAKREGLKKDSQIRKLAMDNYRKVQASKRKEEEVKRIKRVNEALKSLTRGSRRSVGGTRAEDGPGEEEERQAAKEEEQFVMKVIKQILGEIEKEQELTQYEERIRSAEGELEGLMTESGEQELRVERLKLKEELAEEEMQELRGLELSLSELRERSGLCEDSLRFSKQKHTSLLAKTVAPFDPQSSVIYNPRYQQPIFSTALLRCLFSALRNFLYQNYSLLTQQQHLLKQLQTEQEHNSELRKQTMALTAQYHQEITQLRQEMMMNRLLGEREREEIEGVNVVRKSEEGRDGKDMKEVRDGRDGKDKRELEKKIQDLSKTNRQLTSQLQKTRKKCEVVNDKYQNIRNLVSKDKNIGTQDVANSGKLQRKATVDRGPHYKATIQQLDGMLDKLQGMDRDKLKKTKSYSNFEEAQRDSVTHGGNERNSTDGEGLLRWECVSKIDAHNSGVLALAGYEGCLLSAASRSIKMWDLETKKMVTELTGPHVLGSVRYLSIDPERQLFYSACQKLVTMWDLRTLQVRGVLKSHRDEVRTICSLNDYLFTGGKGSNNGSSLLIWDMRKLNMNQPLEDKQKNQDIMAMTAEGGTLYYGTRNHWVRRMQVKGFEIQAPFEPPHLDSVTSLVSVRGSLVSGSKDKHLRLWDPNAGTGHAKHTLHLFNDYVNCLHHPTPSSPLFYAGSKDGQVKACFPRHDKIEVIGGFLTHTQPVNCMASASDLPNTLITGSQDKTVKLWAPSKETQEHLGAVCNF